MTTRSERGTRPASQSSAFVRTTWAVLGGLHALFIVALVLAWSGVRPPRLLPIGFGVVLVLTLGLLVLGRSDSRTPTARRNVALVLAFCACAVAAVTALSVARRSFAACQAQPHLDALVHVDRGYDLLHNQVACTFTATDGRSDSGRVDAWTVLLHFSPE